MYTKKEPRPAFRYRINKGKKDQGVRFVTLVAPYEVEQPEVKVKVRGKPGIGSSRLVLKVKAKGF